MTATVHQPLSAGLSTAQVRVWRASAGAALGSVASPSTPVWQSNDRADVLAQETPVALVFNGISHTVMMASALDLEDFALGFGLTEGLLATPSELYGVEIEHTEQGIALQLHVSAACEWRLKDQRRTLAGRTGCGLCGTDQLDHVRRQLPAVQAQNVSPAVLVRAQAQLKAHQTLQQQCGATHAAAWVSWTGEMECVREDVGRHNALDKLIGALVRAGTSPHGGFVCITSRASFEMVQKTVALGAGVLAAVSAPTALAVQVAQDANLCLAGFVRDQGLSVYTYPERIE